VSVNARDKMAGVLGALGKGALNVGKGMFGMGPTAKAGLAGKALNYGAQAYTTAAPVMSAMSTGKGGASVNMPWKSAAVSPVLRSTYAKLAHLGASDLADVASYGSFIGAKLVDPHKHPKLHAALDAAGLLGLGATTAHSMFTNPADRGPSAKDLTGLALMGSALFDRMRSGGH